MELGLGSRVRVGVRARVRVGVRVRAQVRERRLVPSCRGLERAPLSVAHSGQLVRVRVRVASW